MGNYKRLIIVAGGIVLLDQITKLLVLQSVPLFESLAVIPGFFNLTHIHNPGGAFGFLADQQSAWRHILFLSASTAAVGVIVYFYKNTPTTQPMLATGFALVCGGAIGNMIDRLRFGRVVDFLDFFVGSWHWPAFNVADSAVSAGIAIFIYHILIKKTPF